MATDLHDSLTFMHSRLERALKIGRVEIKEVNRRCATSEARKPRCARYGAPEANYRKMDDAEKAKIVELWNCGRTIIQIKHELKREWSHVRTILISFGIDPATRRRVTVRETVEGLLLSGMPLAEVLSMKITASNYVRSIAKTLEFEGKIKL